MYTIKLDSEQLNTLHDAFRLAVDYAQKSSLDYEDVGFAQQMALDAVNINKLHGTIMAQFKSEPAPAEQPDIEVMRREIVALKERIEQVNFSTGVDEAKWMQLQSQLKRQDEHLRALHGFLDKHRDELDAHSADITSLRQKVSNLV